MSVCHEYALQTNFVKYRIQNAERKVGHGWIQVETGKTPSGEARWFWERRTRGRLNVADWLDCELGFHRKLGFAKFESRAPKVPTAIERQ